MSAPYNALGTLILKDNPFGGTANLGGFNLWFKNYNNKWGGQSYGLINSAIGAGADLAGNLINSNGLSHGVGNVMSGIGNVVGNIPGPIGWAGKGLALAGLAVNALWGHKFNDANVAAAESANRERSNWLFGDYSNTDALLAGSMANILLGNVSKGFLGKEGPFSSAVTDKMNLINNDRMLANLRANNSELNAYNNYLTGMVRNAIAGDSMGNVNAAAAGGPLSMISGPMTPFGNRYFANGGYTHGGLFTNGFIEVNNGGSHELNPNQGVLYGVDPQGTPNMVEEGETILDDYVFSNRIKFPKKYKDEFSLGGKIWKKSFADVSKMIAKESEERPNDPISQRSLKAMGGKLADIQEEVKAKQVLDKMDPREVMAMLLQLAMMLQGGEQPLMEQQLMMADPYQQQMMLELGMEEQPIMAANGGGIYIKPSKRGTFTAAATKHGMGVLEFASLVLSNPDNYSSSMVKKANFARNAAKWHACGGKLHGYGGNLYSNGGNVNLFLPGGQTNIPNYNSQYSLPNLLEYLLNMINNINMLEIKRRGKRTKTTSENTSTPKEETTTTNTPLDITQYGFKKGIKGLSALETIYNKTDFADPKSIATLLYHYVDNGIIDYKDAAKLFYNISHNTFPGLKEGENSAQYLKNLLGLRGEGYDEPVYKTDKNGNVIKGEDGNPVEDKAKSKHYNWVGPEYFKAMANLPNTFKLSRGFKGNKDLRGLEYSFDENSNVDDFLDYLTAYGSTDPQVQAKYLNEKRAETEKLYRDYYNENKDFDNLLEDIKYYNDSLSNEGGQSDLIIKNAQASYEDRVAEALASKNTAEKEAIMEDLDDILDYFSYGDDPIYQALLYESDGNPIDVESISAVDPNSEDFKKLTPLLQKIARGKWIKENFENNKEWKTYRELFEKEEADELAKKQREEELLKSLEYNALPTWMRYAPLAFSSIATLTDALGLTNKADLTPYNQLIALSDALRRTNPVRYHPVFLPLQYQPMNLNYDLQQANNMYAATNRNINNISGGNVGAGMAGTLTALNSAGNNYDKIRRATTDQNLANMRAVAEYNNKGAYQDTAGSMEAQKINAINTQNAQKFGYQALSDALRYYQAEQQAANAAKQVNLTHAVNSWANVGRENMYMNMINSNKAWDYRISQDGSTFYKNLVKALNT